MATDIHAPRTYYCPKCGKKHAADMSAMEGHPEIHGKVRCVGCHVVLWLSLGEDGEPVCELYEARTHGGDRVVGQGAGASAPAAASTPAAAAAHAGASENTGGGGASWLGPILAAAVVAGLVSFFVGKASGGSSDATKAPVAPETDAAQADALAAMEALGGRLDSIEQDLGDTRAQLTRLSAEVQAAASGDDAALAEAGKAAAEARTAVEAMSDRFGKLEAAYKGLNGRIELNYTNLRLAEKRLKELAGEDGDEK